MGRLNNILIVLISLAVASGSVFCGPRNADTLIYTHLTHEKKYGVGACETCHENIQGSRKAADDNFSDDMSCHTADCHDIKDQKSCITCHTNPNAQLPPKPKREVIHSHKAHKEESVACTECHTDIYSKTHFTRQTMPDMLSCLPCHQKKRVSNKCDYCHTDPDYALSHGIHWKKEHGGAYHRDKSCGQCHTQYHCDRCHQGLEPLAVHGGNYLYTHQFDVYENQTQCYACHAGAGYCNDCHIKSWGAKSDHFRYIKKSGSCKDCH